MAQHDYNIANQSGAAFRADLNNALLAIVSQNSGTSAPSTTFAHQLWADTTTSTLKIRNAANSAWIELMQLDGTLTMEDGTALLPGLAFRDDLNTGLFSDAADTLGITTNGVERVEFGTSAVVFNDGGNDVDFRIEGDTNANLFFVDAGNDRVGIGNSSPGANLDIYTSASRYVRAFPSSGIADFEVLSNNNSQPVFAVKGTGSADLFRAFADTTQAVTIDSSGRLGIGVTSPGYKLSVQASAGATSAQFTDATNSTLRVMHPSAGVGLIAVGSSQHLALGTAYAENARIDSSGRLLVGTTTSSSATSYIQSVRTSGQSNALVESKGLADSQISSYIASARRSGGSFRYSELGLFKHSGITEACSYLRLQSTDGQVNYFWTDDSDQFRISTNANHIGTTSGTVVGTQTSDERLKNVGETVAYGLTEVLQLQPKQYALKTEPETNKLGFIAQEVESIIPEAVFDTGEELEGHQEGDRTKLGMEYVQLIPVLVNAIKEQQATITDLQTRLAALETN